MDENNKVDIPEYEALNSNNELKVQEEPIIEENAQQTNFNSGIEDPSLKQNNESVEPKIDLKKDYINKAIDTVDKIVNTKDNSDLYKKSEVNENKSSAILCYIPFLVIFQLISRKHKKSNYMYFHINQGVTLSLTFTAVCLVNKLLMTLFTFKKAFGYSYTPGIIEFVCYLLFAGVCGLILTGIINTINDYSKELPIIGKYKFIK